jgi:pyrroloquinoline-quinone synthase
MDRHCSGADPRKQGWGWSVRRLSRSEFLERLLAIMDRKHHWAWPHFSSGAISKQQLKTHFQQEYAVYVRDFPVFLARIHGKNPPRPVRTILAANIYEEETGGLSFGQPHPELFLEMMQGLGYRRRDFEQISLLPASRRYRAWLDRVTGSPDWLAAAAVLTIFVEGSVQDRREILRPSPPKTAAQIEQTVRNHALVRHHGLSPLAMNLVRAHQKVEAGHRQDAYEIVLTEARTPGQQQNVIRHLEEGLGRWLAYRDGVARACGLARA